MKIKKIFLRDRLRIFMTKIFFVETLYSISRSRKLLYVHVRRRIRVPAGSTTHNRVFMSPRPRSSSRRVISDNRNAPGWSVSAVQSAHKYTLAILFDSLLSSSSTVRYPVKSFWPRVRIARFRLPFLSLSVLLLCPRIFLSFFPSLRGFSFSFGRESTVFHHTVAQPIDNSGRWLFER